MKYYEFTCTEEEYDPKRVIRECVEDGRLWFVYKSTKFKNTFALCIRKDFLEKFAGVHNDHIGGEHLGPDWGWDDEMEGYPDCPRGYRAHWHAPEELKRALRILGSLKPKPKPKTYRVYYHGGK